jgi:PBP1b-binding outer membrane lipoprotein LpoB
MLKKILIILMITAIAMFSFACGEKASSKSEDTQASDTSVAEDESTGLEWPSQYMSTLPAPDSKISRVEKLNGTEEIAEDDTTTQPSSVNVVMNEMTKDEALAYYDKLKNAGFEINSDEKSKDKILLVGTLNDADKNPFLFSYVPDEEFGNVSITILKGIYGGDVPDNMKSDSSSSDVSGGSTQQ